MPRLKDDALNVEISIDESVKSCDGSEPQEESPKAREVEPQEANLHWFYRLSWMYPIIAVLILAGTEYSVLNSSLHKEHQEKIAHGFYDEIETLINKHRSQQNDALDELRKSWPKLDADHLGIVRAFEPANLVDQTDRGYTMKPYEEVRKFLYPNFKDIGNIIARQSISWSIGHHYWSGLIGFTLGAPFFLLTWVAAYLQNKRTGNALYPGCMNILLLLVGIIPPITMPLTAFFDMFTSWKCHYFFACAFFATVTLYYVISVVGMVINLIIHPEKRATWKWVIMGLWSFFTVCLFAFFYLWTTPWNRKLHAGYSSPEGTPRCYIQFEWNVTWHMMYATILFSYVFYKLNKVKTE